MSRSALGVRGRIAGGVTAVAFLLLADALAFAHDFKVGERTFEPDPQDDTIKFHMTVGRKLKFDVVDRGTCRATITGENLVGANVVKADKLVSKGSVVKHTFKLEALAPGTFTMDVRIVGDTALDPTCTENRIHKVQITVSAAPEGAEKAAGGALKSKLKTLDGALKTQATAVSEKVRDHVESVRTGALTPTMGYWQIGDAALDGLLGQRQAVDTAQNAFRADLTQLISTGGFPAGCPPRGLTRGGYGPWDAFGYEGGARLAEGAESLGGTMSQALAQIEQLGSGDGFGIRLGGFVNPAPRPFAAPPGIGPQTTPPGLPLGIGIVAGVSEHSQLGVDSGAIWAGGWSDPARGQLIVELESPLGGTVTSSATPDGNGKWSVLLTGPKLAGFGLDYKLGVGYATDTATTSEVFTLPKLWTDPRDNF